MHRHHKSPKPDEGTKLFIKNMVCPRCIMIVEQVLKKMKVHPLAVGLGTVELAAPLTEQQMDYFSKRLTRLGFELLQDKKMLQVEAIKTLLIKKLQQERLESHFSIKKYLSSEIKKEYTFLSKLFSETTGTTIEQYFIELKIEKAKELISYGQRTLHEIADALGYCSVPHLSAQFKKVAGVSPIEFKKRLLPHRKPIDQIGLLPNIQPGSERL